MDQDASGYRVWVSIVSSGRPSNVRDMEQKVGPATWYVPPNEYDAYVTAGATSVHACRTRGQCIQRNDALQDAFQRGLPCVQLDDDLKTIHRGFMGPEKVQRQKIDFNAALRVVMQRLNATQYYLGGISHTDNLLNYKPGRETSYTNFIRSSFMVIKPCVVFWDEDQLLKIDYDYTLQHLAAYGGAVRCNDILPTFPYGTNAGGCQQIRNDTSMKEAIARVRQKWSACLHDNPRRTNEVVLRWKPGTQPWGTPLVDIAGEGFTL